MNWAGTQKGEGSNTILLALAISVALIVRGAGSAFGGPVAGDSHGRSRRPALPRLGSGLASTVVIGMAVVPVAPLGSVEYAVRGADDRKSA
jgi:hypothetical protein